MQISASSFYRRNPRPQNAIAPSDAAPSDIEMNDEEEEIIDEAILTAVEMDDEEVVPAPPKAKQPNQVLEGGV